MGSICELCRNRIRWDGRECYHYPELTAGICREFDGAVDKGEADDIHIAHLRVLLSDSRNKYNGLSRDVKEYREQINCIEKENIRLQRTLKHRMFSTEDRIKLNRKFVKERNYKWFWIAVSCVLTFFILISHFP